MVRSRGLALVLAVLALALLLPVLRPAAAHAGPGDLDPAFGRQGLVRVDLTKPSLDVANAAINNIYGLVAAGSAQNSFALGYFGGGGEQNPRAKVIVDFGRPSEALALADATSPYMVAAGRAGDDFAVASFWDWGDPDIAFGDGGRVTTAFGAPAVAHGVVEAGGPGGLRYVAVGSVGSGAGADLAVVGYDRVGALVGGFGTGGKVVTDVTGGADVARAVAVDWNGSVAPLVVAGQAGADLFVTRYTLDGRLDPAFGDGGRVVLNLTPGDDVATSVSLDEGGRILVAGSAGGRSFAARLSRQGALDPTFGHNGVFLTDLGGATSRINSILPWFGEVVVAGTVSGPAGDDAALALLSTGGGFDPAFSGDGLLVVDSGGRNDSGNGLALPDTSSRDQYFMLVGGDGADMTAVHASPDGTLFGAAPFLPPTLDFGAPTSERAVAAAVEAGGRVLVGGDGDRGLLFTRLLADGTLDPTFGQAGVSVIPINGVLMAMTVRPDGRFVALVSSKEGMGVYGFSATGALDGSFGLHGFAYIGAAGAQYGALALDLGGRVVAASTNGIVRLTPSGQADASFRANGPGSSYVGLVAQPDGKVVSLGGNGPDNVGENLTRYNEDGTVDEGFLSGGRVSPVGMFKRSTVLRAQSDGKLVVGGDIAPSTLGSGAPTDVIIARYNTDGTDDRTFGTLGVTQTNAGDNDRMIDLVLDPGGAMTAVFEARPAGVSGFSLARYGVDGRADRSFGVNGVRPLDGLEPVVAVPGPGASVTLAGAVTSAASARDLAVARYSPRVVPTRPALAWGWNVLGQVGSGGPAGNLAPDAVPGLSGVTAMSAGALHSLAVTADGAAWAWGWNAHGQLGDGSTRDAPAPQRVPGLSGVVGVSAGLLHSLAVKADGTVWAWGWNGLGALGTGARVDSHVPVQVLGLSDMVAVAAGAYHSLALSRDGTVWAWGWNGFGQLGDGTTVDRLAPVRTAMRSGNTAIAAGIYHSLALGETGVVMAWGWNQFGQTGQPPGTNTTYPDAVFRTSGPFIAVAAGGLHSMALKADGSVWSFGWNGLGQLGDSTAPGGYQPVQVKGVTGAVSIAAGLHHSLALMGDGTLRAWGWNGVGQLGTGTTMDAREAVLVPGVVNRVGIAAGYYHSLAF